MRAAGSGGDVAVMARAPSLGVVIPTYNRSQVLLSCLIHLESQTIEDFEVVVVDDGSTDDTPEVMKRFQARTGLRIRYIRQPNSGPSRARNVGIAHLHAPLCLLIGDDIFASPRLVEIHLELHRRRDELWVAALGLTRWSESGQVVTPFMRWLEEGVQFAYPDLLGGLTPTWRHFYTSNISLKTPILREHPFDESFKGACVEDLELGFRLERQVGLEIEFLPNALADHLHPTTFLQSCKRIHDVGNSTRIFHERCPGAMASHRNSPFRRLMRAALLSTSWMLKPVTRLADRVTELYGPNPLMKMALMWHGLAGYYSEMRPRQRIIAALQRSPSR